MSATSFEFPYRFQKFDGKKLAYPEIAVQLFTFVGKQTHYFIFDSGADITTMPDYMIDVLQVPKKKLIKSRSFGISGEPISSREATIPVRIRAIAFDLPVTFIPNKDIPLLLGKEGIFDRFNIILDNNAEKTILQLRY